MALAPVDECDSSAISDCPKAAVCSNVVLEVYITDERVMPFVTSFVLTYLFLVLDVDPLRSFIHNYILV